MPSRLMLTGRPTASSADAVVQRPDIPATEAAAETLQRKKDLKEQRAREAAEKKAARKAEREANGGAAPQAKAALLRFKPREWAAVEGLEKLEVQGTEISLMTWNVSELGEGSSMAANRGIAAPCSGASPA